MKIITGADAVLGTGVTLLCHITPNDAMTFIVGMMTATYFGVKIYYQVKKERDHAANHEHDSNGDTDTE